MARLNASPPAASPFAKLYRSKTMQMTPAEEQIFWPLVVGMIVVVLSAWIVKGSIESKITAALFCLVLVLLWGLGRLIILGWGFIQ